MKRRPETGGHEAEEFYLNRKGARRGGPVDAGALNWRALTLLMGTWRGISTWRTVHRLLGHHSAVLPIRADGDMVT